MTDLPLIYDAELEAIADPFADSVIHDTPESRAELEKEWRCTDTEAQLILDILFGRLNHEEADRLDFIDRSTYWELDRSGSRRWGPEEKLRLIDAMPGAIGDGSFGVSTINMEPSDLRHEPEGIHLDMGDSYNTTILWDSGEHRWLLTTQADFQEHVERIALDEAEAPDSSDLTYEGLEVDDTTKVAPGAWIVHHILEWPADYPDLPTTGYVSFAYQDGVGPDSGTCHFSLLEEVGEEWQGHYEGRPELAGLEKRELPFGPKMIGFVPEQPTPTAEA